MTDTAIQAALNYHTIVNATPGRWARFEAQKFTHELVVRVYTGTIHAQGTEYEIKETYDTIRSFFSHPDGKVTFLDHRIV